MHGTSHRRQGPLRAAAAALLVAGALSTASHAHDATDGPSRAPEGPSHSVAGAGTSAGEPTSLRPPLVLVGAGALMAGLGGWLVYEDEHQKASACANLPIGRAQCTQPSVGPGIGAAMIVVGAQAAVGGLVWLALRWHGRPTPVALQLGPGTLALRGRF
jgi:hypothetical protein